MRLLAACVAAALLCGCGAESSPGAQAPPQGKPPRVPSLSGGSLPTPGLPPGATPVTPPETVPPDTTPPELSLEAPVALPIRGTLLAAVRGQVAADAVQVEVHLPTEVVEVAGGSRFRLAAPLFPGTNLVQVEAADQAGNREVVQVEVEVATPVAAGNAHSVAVIDGSVWTWGANGNGALGRGPGAGEAPAPVEGLPPIRSVAAGGNTTAALGVDGEIFVWGALAGTSTPIVFPEAGEVVGVAVGLNHMLVLEADGTVLAFGANGKGQLGLGHTELVRAPERIPGLAGVVRVVAGSEHSAALLADGSVRVWGANGEAQLGNGDIDAAPHPTPVPVAQLAGLVDLAAGRGHTLALDRDGKVWAWGLGTSGQLGVGESGMMGTRVQPVQLTSLPPIEAIYAGGQSSFVLAADGTLYGFGRNANGQLGTGRTGERALPVPAASGRTVRAVALGALHTVAVGTSEVLAFGNNGSGQLGVAELDRAVEPVEVMTW